MKSLRRESGSAGIKEHFRHCLSVLHMIHGKAKSLTGKNTEAEDIFTPSASNTAMPSDENGIKPSNV